MFPKVLNTDRFKRGKAKMCYMGKKKKKNKKDGGMLDVTFFPGKFILAICIRKAPCCSMLVTQ